MNKPDFGMRVVEMDVYEDGQQMAALVTNFPVDANPAFFGTEYAQPVQSAKKQDAGKEYITWGNSNRLPSDIISRANDSPYIAPSLKKLIDSTYSAGVKMWYVYYTEVNGKMQRNQIEYEAAGMWLENRLAEAEAEWDKAHPVTTAKEKEQLKAKDTKLNKLKQDLKAWTETNTFLETFAEENNIALWLYEQAADATYFWNWFTMFRLSVGRPDEPWTPKIVGLNHLEATCTRKGIADEYGRVNYCVYSRGFADLTDNTKETLQEQTVIDALDPHRAAAHLREIVERQKDNKIRSRKLEYVLPLSMPTPGKMYYAWPSWWSVFKSGIYNYMLAMFARRAMMMKNATMFKYIIHLDEQYVEYEYSRCGATTDEAKLKVFNSLIQSISDFIKNPKNNGKTLISMSKTIDGKKVKWVEVEVIENPMKGSDIKEDIAEIANVMLFAMGIHPQTVGAIPGKDKVASGTEARELNTLQQLYLFPVKMLLMYPLYVIKSFNKLDSHLFFDIPVHVLTTLDKNKQGVEEMNN